MTRKHLYMFSVDNLFFKYFQSAIGWIHDMKPTGTEGDYRVIVTLHSILNPNVWLCSLIHLWGGQGQAYNKYALRICTDPRAKKKKSPGKATFTVASGARLGQVRTLKFNTQLLISITVTVMIMSVKDNEQVFDPGSTGQKALCNSLPGCFLIYEGRE